jgi:ABC-type sugar transport system ATPase subunit
MVFQNYALYPHKTVAENLAFALRVRGVDESQIRERVGRTAAALGIDALLTRKPAQLSGGQRQRVALGRAIVREPKAFLLDEPLSNLDPVLRAETRAELAVLHRRLGSTMVYVTHDQEEAMTLGRRVVVMRAGGIEQAGPPMELYRRPANLFVARFVGSPAMNVLRCAWTGAGRCIRAVGSGLSVDVVGGDGTHADGDEVVLGVRPQDVSLAPLANAEAIGHVELLEPLGATTIAHVRIEGVPGEAMRIVIPSGADCAVDRQVGVRLRREGLHFFEASTGRRLAVLAPGQGSAGDYH